MQRQFTFELRVDYADNEKNEVMRQAFQRFGRNVYATASLLSDGIKPQVALFSDDFFDGHMDIALLEDTVAQGEAEIGGEDTAVSAELLEACKVEPK